MKVNKIKFPKTLKVGGMVYKIIFPYTFTANQDCAGLHNGETAVIRVANKCPTDIILETLLHELLHAIDTVYCNSLLEEDYININSKAWFQVLKENNLYLLEDKMPKRIKVGGFYYDINFPYFFEEFENNLAGQTANFDLKIRINNDSDGEKNDSRFVKVCLIFCIQNAICNLVFSSEKEEKSIEVFKSKSFAYGLYQVLVDNKIEQIIDKYKSR